MPNALSDACNPAIRATTGEPEVAVIVSARAWSGALPNAARVARRAARAALRQAGGGDRVRSAELSLLLADDARIRLLNRDYRGLDQATNVLAFAAAKDDQVAPGPMMLGDVALAFETVAAEAADQMKSLEAHLSHLVVHGVLHLLGYDHERAEAAEQMERLEVVVLARLGIADPYALPDAVPHTARAGRSGGNRI